MSPGRDRAGDGARFLAVTGPTASGKTRLSLELVPVLDAEIVSVDSRQVYRGLDVGTAKVTLPERARAAHHGLDLLDPDEPYSAGRFARDARGWVREIRGRCRVPLLVGGSGFFLKALMEPLFREPPLDEERVERLREHLEGYPREKLEAWVRALDPGRADVAAEGGPQRLTRTLEVALLSGRPLSVWHEEADTTGRTVPGRVVCLTLPRDELDRRIRERAEAMVRGGLVEEVRRHLRAGYGPDDPGLTGAGYREVVEHLRGSCSLEEAVDRIEVRTRQYARRQLTWFRNQLPDDAVRIEATAPLEEQVRRAAATWDRERSVPAGSLSRGRPGPGRG